MWYAKRRPVDIESAEVEDRVRESAGLGQILYRPGAKPITVSSGIEKLKPMAIGGGLPAQKRPLPGKPDPAKPAGGFDPAGAGFGPDFGLDLGQRQGSVGPNVYFTPGSSFYGDWTQEPDKPGVKPPATIYTRPTTPKPGLEPPTYAGGTGVTSWVPEVAKPPVPVKPPAWPPKLPTVTAPAPKACGLRAEASAALEMLSSSNPQKIQDAISVLAAEAKRLETLAAQGAYNRTSCEILVGHLKGAIFDAQRKLPAPSVSAPTKPEVVSNYERAKAGLQERIRALEAEKARKLREFELSKKQLEHIQQERGENVRLAEKTTGRVIVRPISTSSGLDLDLEGERRRLEEEKEKATYQFDRKIDAAKGQIQQVERVEKQMADKLGVKVAEMKLPTFAPVLAAQAFITAAIAQAFSELNKPLGVREAGAERLIRDSARTLIDTAINAAETVGFTGAVPMAKRTAKSEFERIAHLGLEDRERVEAAEILAGKINKLIDLDKGIGVGTQEIGVPFEGVVSDFGGFESEVPKPKEEVNLLEGVQNLFQKAKSIFKSGGETAVVAASSLLGPVYTAVGVGFGTIRQAEREGPGVMAVEKLKKYVPIEHDPIGTVPLPVGLDRDWTKRDQENELRRIVNLGTKAQQGVMMLELGAAGVGTSDPQEIEGAKLIAELPEFQRVKMAATGATDDRVDPSVQQQEGLRLQAALKDLKERIKVEAGAKKLEYDLTKADAAAASRLVPEIVQREQDKLSQKQALANQRIAALRAAISRTHGPEAASEIDAMSSEISEIQRDLRAKEKAFSTWKAAKSKALPKAEVVTLGVR